MAVIAVVDDLFFAVKIREAAQQTGVAIDIVSAPKFWAALETHAGEGSIEAVILDLNSTAALGVIGKLKAAAQTRSLPVVGFVSHVAADVITSARAAGCDQVLARSAFTKQLPELLRSLGQGPEVRGQEAGRTPLRASTQI
ncbi:MAG TPA: response regulator [Terriglobia bacterium]|nr:response regulator [Terriglobia bacterium]